MYKMLPALACLLSLAMARPSAPLAGRDGEVGCQDRQFGDFLWTVKGFDYHASYIFSTPAHQNSWGYVNFNLSNSGLPYEAACSATSNQLSDFFYGTVNYTCTFPAGSASEATFAFSRPSGKLDLYQKWTCSDKYPQYPTTYWAYGTTNLTLDCTDKTDQNPDWQIGEIYSDREVKCSPLDVKVKPYQLSAIA